MKSQGAGSDVDEPEYSVRISRVRDGSMITVDATDETMLSPGDVVEVKLKRRVSEGRRLYAQAIESLGSFTGRYGADPASSYPRQGITLCQEELTRTRVKGRKS